MLFRRAAVIIMGGASHARPKILSRQRRLLFPKKFPNNVRVPTPGASLPFQTSKIPHPAPGGGRWGLTLIGA